MLSHNVPKFTNLSCWDQCLLPRKAHKRARIYGAKIVDLYLSTFENRIDKKGRVSVPASYRAVLERRRETLYLFKHLTLPCLEGCGYERIEQIVDAIDGADDVFSKETQTLHTMLSSAQEMKLDAEGRIMLPADFMEFAGIEDMVVYAGIGRSFLVWQPSEHKKRDGETRQRIKKDGGPKLRLGGKGRPSGEGGGRS